MPGRVWRKSTYSGNWDDNCVEIAPAPAGVGVRDSKQPAPQLAFGAGQWRAFIARGANAR
ncbi:DUF397 domain-containing protein [Embleya sp. NPDC005971]|uniref:DUF397 domain-containing protein n=1 Tax=Embleya sp. NPDC005971 TaxID=3156724 RepID=UPI0033FFE003